MTKSSWLSNIEAILLSDSDDLRSLAKAAGGDPDIFYINQDLSGCDLSGQDLRGMNLTGTNIANATINGLTLIDPDFDHRPTADQYYTPVNLTVELFDFLDAYSSNRGYSYKAWAYKDAINRGIRILKRHEGNKYINLVIENGNFSKFIYSEQEGITEIINISREAKEFSESLSLKIPQPYEIYSMIMAVGAISYAIRRIGRKDYSNLTPNALFPPKS